MFGDILATNAWSVTLSWLFFIMISSPICHWHRHDKFRLKRNPCQRHELHCDDQRWDSNSCCDHHMLGDICCGHHIPWPESAKCWGLIVCVELLVNHLVFTVSDDDHHDITGDMRSVRVVPSNKMSMFSRCVWPDIRSNHTQLESMSVLLLGTTIQVFFNNFMIITDKKCRDQVCDQVAKQNITEHVIGPPTFWVSPLIISVVYVSWFELRFSHEFWWHLVALFTARKNHDFGCVGIKLSLSVIWLIVINFACRVWHAMTHFHWVSAMNIKQSRICSLISVVIIPWFSRHFATLLLCQFRNWICYQSRYWKFFLTNHEPTTNPELSSRNRK